jgi:hypothetical protein
MLKGINFKRAPFKCIEADAYVTAINILAVEYLVKTQNPEEYSRRTNQVSALTDDELSVLWVWLSMNRHTSTLGAMITRGDYEYQRDDLLEFLDDPESR